MRVEFEDLDSILDELRKSEDVRVVRVSVSSAVENRGVSNVTLTCGFHDQSYFYEASLPCGQDLAGGKHEATQEAERLLARIQATCDELGISCRSGRYQWPT